ncbi:helix-turn-helix domain-containing protein [Sporomusa acidovorans]|uniref:Helix-turn-helix domain-containing protein n=1 Tax=Sporomusa acidovorans (strain ATCC 49682 / DSM 3132 / Mol) TaxID=1123286 RepID=A0ABZ3IYX5_SPOA4|nr:helix-turn-helix domain-containing protein [Sporomusa acidovorans]OZC22086.1 helix-turn-helix domain protein [Sporomusa acidovorans DSM 3132]SDF66079.1 hypothetical protein SAMN04488499_106611 [Sporomusa acidovorans]
MEVLNDKELAKKIDPSGKIVTPWTIRKWRIEGGMPSFKVGRRIFFRLESVMKWMDEREKSEQCNEPQEYGTLRKIY